MASKPTKPTLALSIPATTRPRASTTSHTPAIALNPTSSPPNLEPPAVPILKRAVSLSVAAKRIQAHDETSGKEAKEQGSEHLVIPTADEDRARAGVDTEDMKIASSRSSVVNLVISDEQDSSPTTNTQQKDSMVNTRQQQLDGPTDSDHDHSSCPSRIPRRSYGRTSGAAMAALANGGPVYAAHFTRSPAAISPNSQMASGSVYIPVHVSVSLQPQQTTPTTQPPQAPSPSAPTNPRTVSRDMDGTASITAHPHSPDSAPPPYEEMSPAPSYHSPSSTTGVPIVETFLGALADAESHHPHQVVELQPPHEFPHPDHPTTTPDEHVAVLVDGPTYKCCPSARTRLVDCLCGNGRGEVVYGEGTPAVAPVPEEMHLRTMRRRGRGADEVGRQGRRVEDVRVEMREVGEKGGQGSKGQGGGKGVWRGRWE